MAGVGAVVTFKLAPDTVEDFKKTFAAAREHVRKEPGNLAWDLHKHRTEADTWFIIELYRDAAAFDHHVAAPHIKEFGPRLRPLMLNTTVAIGDGA